MSRWLLWLRRLWLGRDPIRCRSCGLMFRRRPLVEFHHCPHCGVTLPREAIFTPFIHAGEILGQNDGVSHTEPWEREAALRLLKRVDRAEE